MVGLLGAAARQQPLVVVWDDLHWCDASSLDVVHALNDRASHYPLLLLLGLRPDPLLLKSLGDHVMALRIGELEARAGAELVATLLKGAPPPALLERLRTSDEGYNPFFVEELLRALIETGVLVQRNGGWELAGDVATLEIPDTIEEVIAARIDRLEARQRETLQTASVIGRRFYYPILAGVANEQRQLQQRLMALASAELLLPEDEQSYLFKHMLTRDAVYASILYARRRELHRRVARRIEEVYGDRLEEQLPLLARHYYAAEDWSPALRYSMAAGRRAQERYHNREALTLFEMALGALSHLEPQQTIEAEAYERMGLALFHMADYEEAWTALERALEILKTAAPDDHEGQARIYRHLAVVAERRADYDLALSLVEQGLRLIEHSDSAEIAALLLVSVGPYQRQGRYAEALVSVEHGLEVARQHNKLRDMAYAYQLLCGIYWRLGQNRQGIEAAKKSLALYTELNDLSGQADAQMNLANILTEVGLFMEAVEYFRAAMRLQETLGNSYGQAMIANNLGDLLRTIGDYTGAMEQFTVALRKFETLGSQFGIAVLHMNIGSVSLSQSNLPEARYHLERSRELFEETGAEEFLTELYRYYAQLALAEGQPHDALTWADRALGFARRLDARAEEGVALRIRGLILKALNRSQEALAALEEARAILVEVGNTGELACCLEDLAALFEGSERSIALLAEAQALRSAVGSATSDSGQ